MFERHFGLRENPFHSGHQLRFLYPSREHQEARAHLRFGIENREPFVLITGEVGTGKTTALYDALAEWGSKVSVALITNSALTRQELIEEIGLRFGLTVPAGASKPQALAMLERHLNGVRARGEHAVLLLDEAQNLAPELLEEIRLLSNLETQGEKLVQIFLVGQPELEALLAQPQLRQLRQRIGVHYRLNPLSPEETTAYIHHRIAVAGGNPFAAFPPETCLAVYRITHGIPREINTVASQAMIAAFSEGANTVVPEHVHAIQRESEFRSVLAGSDNDVPDSPAAAVLREDRAVEPAPKPAPAPPPAPPPAPAPVADPEAAASSEAANEPTHAWLPPELGEVPAAASAPAPPAPEPAPVTAPVAAKEPEQVIDAWAAAAKDLMEAKRRGEVAAQDDRVEVVAHDAHAEPAPAAQFAPKFPSLAELTQRAESARPDNADLSGLPARLRAKIAADIEAEERRETNKRRLVPIVLGVMIVAALATGTLLLQRFQVIDVPVLRNLLGMPADSTTHAPVSAPAPAPVAATPETTAVDTTHVATPATAPDNSAAALPPPTSGADDASTTMKPATTTAVAPAPAKPVTSAPIATAKPTTPVSTPMTKPAPAAGTPVTKPATATSAPTTTTPAATTNGPATKPAAPTSAPATKPATTAPTTAPAADGPVYGLGVAAYLDRDRAEEKRAELAARGGLPATIVPFDDGGTTRYRIIVGRYPSNAAAENAALGVMTKLGVSEARPLLLSRGKAR